MLIGKGSVFFLRPLFTVSASEIQAGLNASATLPCNVTLPGPTDMSLIQVSWTSNGSSVASFSNSIPNTESGFSWNASRFDNGDFSLTILRTSFNLQGLYECTVSNSSTMWHSSNVTFSILGEFASFSARPDVNAWTCHQFVSFYDPPTAPPSSYSVPPTLDVPRLWLMLETESHLTCRAHGFYPPPIAFSWTRAGIEIQTPTDQVQGEPTPNGLYTATGNLTIYPSREDQNVTFGCRVLHSGRYQELEFNINVTCEWYKEAPHMKSIWSDRPGSVFFSCIAGGDVFHALLYVLTNNKNKFPCQTISKVHLTINI